jgi:hypothetical protein
VCALPDPRDVAVVALPAISLGVAALQVSNMGPRIAEASTNSLLERIPVLAFRFVYTFLGTPSTASTST